MIKFISQLASVRISPVILAFLLIIPQNITAQEPLNAHPAVWLIEKENSKTYFLGSIHLLPNETKWYGGIIEEIFEETDEVVFEVYMTQEKQIRAQQIMLQYGRLPQGDFLSNYIDTEVYNLLLEQASSVGIPSGSVAIFKPWFVSTLLSIEAIKKEGLNTESGVDKYIETMATTRNIPISELETLEAQLATLYDHPIDVQAAMLKDTLDQIAEIKKITMDMVASWASGDEEKMKEAFITPMQQQREIYRKLVIERNKNWLPVIDGFVDKSQTTLVVAGVAHFIGEDGLVKLLESKGYDVKRVQ